MLRLLIVDDHLLLREALKIQLARLDDTLEIYEASDGAEALVLFERHLPDVALLDVDLPDGHSFPLVEKLRNLQPECKVMFLTGFDYDSFIEQAIGVGANGYALKSDGISSLLEAIRVVRGGGRYFSPSIERRLELRDGRLHLAHPRCLVLATLTRRERELLAYLGRGASLKEAAARMDVSYKTADNQKTSLMKKLGIHDRVELARFAIREGLISA